MFMFLVVSYLFVFLFFFFFQAEDGIRDGHVTGVQTCALPIFFLLFLPFSFLGESSQLDDVSSLGDASSLAVVSSDDSEEPSRLAMSIPLDATLAPGLLSPQPSQNVR